jgi:hypothetical protein
LSDAADDGPKYGGLNEEDFDRLAQVKAMDDAALLNAYRALSNPKQIDSSSWLPFIEAELRHRGLLSSH